MAEPEDAERFVEVLKEIRDELRAVRIELGGGGARMPSGIRTRLVNRGPLAHPALVAAGVAGLALVLGLALRDRPAPQPATVAVAPQSSAPLASNAETRCPVDADLGPPARPSAGGGARGRARRQTTRGDACAGDQTVERLPAAAPAVAAVPALAKSVSRSDDRRQAAGRGGVRRRRDDGVPSVAEAGARAPPLVRTGRLRTGEALRAALRSVPPSADGARRQGHRRRTGIQRRRRGRRRSGRPSPSTGPGIGGPVSSARPNPHPAARDRGGGGRGQQQETGDASGACAINLPTES